MSDKWNYATKEWYLAGKDTRQTFKVLVKDEACIARLKRYAEVLSARGGVVLVTMDRKALERITDEECVVYVELVKRVKPER